MKNSFIVFLLFFFSFCVAQENLNDKIIDSLFREDQFYASISYNLVQNRPSGFKQYSFSSGITVGFLRDFPISKDRKWAIAPGFGYNYNNIKQFVNSQDILGDVSGVDPEDLRTKIVTHLIDFPVEFRWRNATPDSHKFWRVYLGFKASYVFSAKLDFESNNFGNDVQNIKDDVNKWQYGTYLSFGYNTWNPYVYYGLNPLFKDGSKLTNFNLGFIFYIL